MVDKIKIKVSSFVANILENDAICYDFSKNKQSNKNALLNKLIPTLVEVRKARRNEIESILKNEYNREESEKIYSAVNTVIDRVYFDGEELYNLEEYIWIRPSKENMAVFDEIENSESKITAQDVSVYIRGLLNEYSRLPQYKREMLIFDYELDIFNNATYSEQIIHFRDKETNAYYKAFAYNYVYGYLESQSNYCIIYDIKNNTIKSIPLYRVKDIYAIKQKYNPSEKLLNILQGYLENCEFENEINMEIQ